MKGTTSDRRIPSAYQPASGHPGADRLLPSSAAWSTENGFFSAIWLCRQLVALDPSHEGARSQREGGVPDTRKVFPIPDPGLRGAR
jgi:hypothetical protein